MREDEPYLTLEPPELLLSAMKPAEEGNGVVIRVLNPTASELEARLTLKFPFDGVDSLQLDEEIGEFEVFWEANTIRFRVPSHGLRTLRVD